jgi:hypothetical protein
VDAFSVVNVAIVSSALVAIITRDFLGDTCSGLLVAVSKFAWVVRLAFLLSVDTVSFNTLVLSAGVMVVTNNSGVNTSSCRIA